MNASALLVVKSLFFILSVKSCDSTPKTAVNPPVTDPITVGIEKPDNKKNTGKLLTGAEQTDLYVPYLKGKRVGMVVNPTSIIGKETSVDSLLKLGVKIVKIFGPEHGFRGNASAGVSVDDDIDAKTGIKAISLYGKHATPTKEDLADVDVMIFDIQDVGVRFYTYISTLTYLMEAGAENNVEILVLDRPNPHDGYVDGPVLKKKWESFDYAGI